MGGGSGAQRAVVHEAYRQPPYPSAHPDLLRDRRLHSRPIRFTLRQAAVVGGATKKPRPRSASCLEGNH